MIRRRAPRRVRRARKGRKVARRSRGAKGQNLKVHTIIFKPASQTLVSSVSPAPGTPPISLNSASGNAVAALRPLFVTPVLPDYSPNISINPSSTALPGCSDLGFGIDFQVQNIENIQSYLGLYDYYRLNWVKVEVENLYSSASSGIPTGGAALAAKPFSELYIANDYDSVATPSLQQQVTGISGVKQFRFTDVKSKVSHVIRPKTSMALETNPATGGLQNLALVVGKTGVWLNSVNAAVNFYGLKMWYTNWVNTQSTAQVSALRFTFTFSVSFKQPLSAC